MIDDTIDDKDLVGRLFGIELESKTKCGESEAEPE